MRQGLPTKIDLDHDHYRFYEGVEYKQFWTGIQKRKLDELEHALVSHLLPVSGQRIVDLGCGYGRLSDCYMDRFQQVIMVDGSMSLLHQAFEKTGGRAIYIACDVTHLPFRTASFDAALLIRVFHHIDDSQACLAELHRILGHEGQFVFNYCNKQNVQRVIRWWLKKATPGNPYSLEPDGKKSTFISHHPKAIHVMLREAGFSRMKYYGAGVFDWLTGKIGLAERGTAAARFLAPFFAWSKIAPWILCQTTAEGNASPSKAMGLEDFLQCPSCRGSLSYEKSGYVCLTCSRCYPIEAGIIDFRVS